MRTCRQTIEIVNSNKTDAEKEELMNQALTSVQNVANNNCSIEVLEQESMME